MFNIIEYIIYNIPKNQHLWGKSNYFSDFFFWNIFSFAFNLLNFFVSEQNFTIWALPVSSSDSIWVDKNSQSFRYRNILHVFSCGNLLNKNLMRINHMLDSTWCIITQRLISQHSCIWATLPILTDHAVLE